MSDNPDDYSLVHHGIKGMKWGRRRKDGPDGTVSGGQSAKPKEMSTATKAVLNKAVLARQDAKKELDRTKANLEAHGTKTGKTGDKVNTGLRLAEGALKGAGGGSGVAIGSHAAYAIYESTERGKKAAVKNAQIRYDAAVAKEARVRENRRGLVEKILDYTDLSAIDLMTAERYAVKD